MLAADEPDQGEATSTDARELVGRCRTDCSLPRCGDGIVDPGEICDDGNVVDGDGCGSAATPRERASAYIGGDVVLHERRRRD
ncbi:MAG: DUF4215 domain-containing protein [Polyangiaceae bacterium]